MAMHLGRPIQKVSIIPNRTRLGACEIKKGRFQPSDDWLEDEVLILFAGVASEARLTGRYDWNGANQDLRNIRALTRSRAGNDTRVEKIERRFLAKTEHLLADDDLWKVVELIAAALLEKETISGRAAMHLYQQRTQKKS